MFQALTGPSSGVSEVIKRCKYLEYDEQILICSNKIKATWEIINIESDRNIKNVEHSY
jgi:hypothetical protein